MICGGMLLFERAGGGWRMAMRRRTQAVCACGFFKSKQNYAAGPGTGNSLSPSNPAHRHSAAIACSCASPTGPTNSPGNRPVKTPLSKVGTPLTRVRRIGAAARM